MLKICSCTMRWRCRALPALPTRAGFFAVFDILQFVHHGRHADGAIVAAARTGYGGAVRQLLLDEIQDADAIALLEGRTQGLPVVGEDQDLVGAGGFVFDDPLEARHLLVELAQGKVGVMRVRTGMVGDFVVAGIQGVHRRRAADDIQDGEIGADIAQEDVNGGAQEWVAIVQPVQAGLDILAPLLPALPDLQEHIARRTAPARG